MVICFITFTDINISLSFLDRNLVFKSRISIYTEQVICPKHLPQYISPIALFILWAKNKTDCSLFLTQIYHLFLT